MTPEEEFMIYCKALESWGEQLQLMKFNEELGELIQPISKMILSNELMQEIERSTMEAFIEEMVDVEIMISQFKLAYLDETDQQTFKHIKNKKLERVRTWLG